ncbi:ABC transporter substrate-binding protein [Rhodococcus sp. DMU1]|uniref:ABC transporter substrate-binding protein n=1 Tax=Rhodococcus sp. DMU1 TaxID=2722825 RepID=UPI00143EDF20|nr:ABC transporter substrate-binding protein [Rhodococcus sp. DMU1]QIX53844.1 ABC transporter substrate-binding protein [Rhodococcus sp. DMU1]
MRTRFHVSRLTCGLTAAAVALTLAGCGAASNAESQSDVIRLGETSGISGPAGGYGKALSEGQQAIFRAVNDAGGVNGKKIELTLLDDGLDVARAVQNVRKLVTDKNIAIVGGSGSGSIDAIVPVLDKAGVPLLFPAKSSPSFVNTVVPQAFALVPTFPDQAHAVVSAAFQKTGAGSVFLVRTVSDQNDAIFAKVETAVRDGGGAFLGTAIVPFGADVTPVALQLAEARPDYVVFTSAPAETTKIVNFLAGKDMLPKKAILGTSSLPGNTFLQGTPPSAHGLLFSLAITKPPADPSAAECLEAVEKYYPGAEVDTVTTFGCAIAQTVVAGLEMAGPNPSSESLADAFASMRDHQTSPLIPPVTFSRDSHMGLTSLPAVTVKDGVYEAVESVSVPVLQ